ncbi:phage portal protein [Hymenobacter setariae]|uniref:Phage portal protein n=1 Tax=Hymenobacter setariae TaxID=2594794 RepID=A0A558BSW5_9BACT|nr:phage portal protein [Hymenobacter setariae]TVT39626.1 phage portal protein [Hymenobacter setariae]
MSFWSNPFARSTATPLLAAVSAEREARTTGATIDTQESNARLIALLGMGSQTSSAGVVVNERTALSFAAVWACVLAISQDIAALPCQLYRDIPSGGKEKVYGHPASRLLNLQASPLQNAMPHRMAMMATVLLHGNAYALIDEGPRYRPDALLYKHPRQTEVRESNGRLYYRFWGDPRTYQDYQVIHLRGLVLDENGIMGLSVLAAHRENLGTGLAAQRAGAQFYANGARLSGVLETPNTFKDGTASARIRADWQAIYGGTENAGKVAVLENGLTFKSVSMPPADAQFLETRKFTRQEVCSIFRVPLHKIQDLERSTNNNIEQQGLDYTTNTLQPWLVNIEQEYRLKLLRDSEVETHYWRHNLNALLRADASARATFYGKMTDIGVMSINEVRELEDMNGIGAEGDRRFVQVNRMPLDKVDEVISKNSKPATGTPPDEQA